MRFEWDPKKEESNVAKHGVPFSEACTVFEDPLSSTASDPDHSAGESRYLTFGISADGRPLVVAHTERGDTIRMISSRLMTRAERQAYESE
jgi:hypothetical protein